MFGPWLINPVIVKHMDHKGSEYTVFDSGGNYQIYPD